jgi:hypothetical protein
VARQRPRSPFGYPARLKRSDMRPASPALTKNGVVDYSRMVELDRVSHVFKYDSPIHFNIIADSFIENYLRLLQVNICY